MDLPAEIINLKERLKKGSSVSIRIMSGSMEPVLKVGETYTLYGLTADYEPRRYDILVYWGDDRLIGHYFEEKSHEMSTQQEVWIFKSLVSQTEDFPVRVEQIVGRVTETIPLRFRLMRELRKRLK